MDLVVTSIYVNYGNALIFVLVPRKYYGAKNNFYVFRYDKIC